MKRISFISLALMAAVALTPEIVAKKKTATDNRKAPAITFAETSHDFGNVPEKGGSVSHEFHFTNTGNAPLLILNVTASCGCTKPDAPKKPIQPGESDRIKVTYLPDGRPGEFSKNISVKTNVKDEKNKNTSYTLRINGFVNPDK